MQSFPLFKKTPRRTGRRIRGIWMVFGQTAVWLGCTAHLSRDVSHHDPGAEPHLTTDVPEHTSTRIYHVISTDEVRHRVSGCRREHEN